MNYMYVSEYRLYLHNSFPIIAHQVENCLVMASYYETKKFLFEQRLYVNYNNFMKHMVYMVYKVRPADESSQKMDEKLHVMVICTYRQ